MYKKSNPSQCTKNNHGKRKTGYLKSPGLLLQDMIAYVIEKVKQYEWFKNMKRSIYPEFVMNKNP
ncbi:MAG: hypothetical protein A2Y97_03545 [Nitrospirae bacterium RBG_13_39_12]|nr:MAG: hypothetical protein A2Y97_03545 [Nitrospirae bacterium RBG_13_39_12]